MSEILYFANLSFSLTSNNKVLFTYFISLLNYTTKSCPATEKKNPKGSRSGNPVPFQIKVPCKFFQEYIWHVIKHSHLGNKNSSNSKSNNSKSCSQFQE